MTVDPDTQSTPAPPAASGFDNDNRQAGSIGDSARDYVNRLRGGDMGSLPAVLGLIFLFVVFASLHDRFLTTYNMANLVIQASAIIVLAMGIVFVLLLGEIDLSAGVAGGACATITALMLIDYDWTWWAATLAGVAFGAVIGLTIGSLVSFLGIPSFVVTLAFFLGLQAVPLKLIGSGGSLRFNDEVLRGLSIKNVPITAGWIAAVLIVLGFAALSLWRFRSLSSKGLVHLPFGLVLIRIAVLAVIVLGLTSLLSANRSPNPSFTISGVPWVAPVVIALLLFWTFVLTKTRFGRHLYAVGGNSEAARRSGVQRVVLASSNHATGYTPRPDEGLLTEADSPHRPDTYYGVSKVTMEALGSLYVDRYGLDVVCLRIGSAIPEPTSLRHLATWLSPTDAVGLVDAALSASAPGFAVVWGVSANTRRWWDLTAAEALGYRSVDDAERYAGALLVAHGEPDPADPVHARVGGEYATEEFDAERIEAQQVREEP